MASAVRPFLMFQGEAEAAIRLYLSLFPGAALVELLHYGPGEAGPEGAVKLAIFTLAGQTLLCTDSVVKHEFGFTPSFSLAVDCESEEEIGRVSAALLEGGQALMPLDHYGFSQRFAWINDRYGVSWQLNLP